MKAGVKAEKRGWRLNSAFAGVRLRDLCGFSLRSLRLGPLQFGT